MVVERHRLDTKRVAQVAHAQRADAALIGKLNGGTQHTLSAQVRANTVEVHG